MTKTKTDTKAKGAEKIALSASRDIPFHKLMLSQSNVRRVKAGVSIEELATDIARRTLLQSLTVRPVLDDSGAETDTFEVPAGGRRYRALELLVKQKRLSRSAPIPCVIRTEGIAEEDSLAENIQRAPLHPLDQFRAFLTLREKGQTEEEIAAVFFVSVAVVKQRLRLASVSPKLHEAYAADEMTLDQLMAFSVSPDHERQEQVWEAIQHSYNKEPYQIRRLLTEGSVRASDKRARYAGDEYAAAGGAVMRDLFQPDDGGWLQDAGLLNRLVMEKLVRDGNAIRAEGWKWVEVTGDFPYGHSYGMRIIASERAALTDAEIARVEALRAEAEQIEEAHAEAEEFSEEADRRMDEIEAELDAIHQRPALYDPAEMARAGTFVSIDGSGTLRVERGYVRPEDEAPVIAETTSVGGDDDGDDGSQNAGDAEEHSETAARQDQPGIRINVGGEIETDGAPTDEDQDESFRPLSDKLLTELTAYRTLALREAVGNDPAIAYLSVLHVLCLKLFYRYALDSCLEIDAKSVMFGNQAPGLGDTPLAARVDARHREWAAQLPDEPAQLWDMLTALHGDSREALFAHCVSLTVNAVHEAYNRRPKAIAHANRLAETVSLDMVAAGWTPTADNYLGRITRMRILEAVREAKGEQAMQRIEPLKKTEMANAAEQLLEGTGWLPEPLRTRRTGSLADALVGDNATETTSASAAVDEAAETASESVATDAQTDAPTARQDELDPQAIAAE